MAKQTAELTPVGVSLDLPPFAAPADVYTDARNMRVRGAGMVRFGGSQKLFDDIGTGALFPPKFGAVAKAGGRLWFVYMGDAGVGVTDGLTHHDVTPLAGWAPFEAGSMTATLYNGVLCFAEPNRPPWYWDGSTAAGAVKPLPGFLANTTTRTLAAFGRNLFAGSLIAGAGSGNDERLAWSDIAAAGAVPATWTPTQTNLAGELLLSTGVGEIQAMRTLAQVLMVYRVVGSWAIQFVGRPYVYTARKVAANVGAASRNAVADVLGQHALITVGDIVLSDGVQVKSIGENRVKASLFAQVSQKGLAVCHAYTLPNKSEVVFALALGRDDACNIAYLWDWVRDKWAVVDYPLGTHSFASYVPQTIAVETWATIAGSWADSSREWGASPQGGFFERGVVASPANDALVMIDFGDVGLDGQPVDGWLERLSMPLGDLSRVKIVDWVYPHFQASTGAAIYVQVGGQIDASDSVTWQPEYLYTVGRSVGVPCMVKGRYISIRFRARITERWTVAGFGLRFADGAVH